MSNIELPDPEEWGHFAQRITPEDILRGVKEQTDHAVHNYEALPDGPEPCRDKDGYRRVSVEIRLTSALFDQLMNGATGYRAHYSVAPESGESFNRRLVEAVAPIIVSAEGLYRDRFDRLLCERSLLGPFSKFWFSKALTDPSAQTELLKYSEEVRVPRWVEYWRERPKPRKGLLAPRPDVPSVLLNGTFVNDAGDVYEQKPGRSKQIFDTGWT